MRALQLMLPKLPPNFRKVDKAEPARDAIAQAEAAKEGRRISPKTLNQHVIDLKSLLKWAVRQEVTTRNPTIIDRLQGWADSSMRGN